MDAKELRAIGEALSAGLQAEGQPIAVIRLQLGRIVSHLESEQESRLAINQSLSDMGKIVAEHDRALFGDRSQFDKHPGLIVQCAEIKQLAEKALDNQKRSKRMLWTVIASALGALTLEIIRLAATHLK